MSLVKLNDKNIEKAAAIIKNGGLVAFPTETVYGLGADAFNDAAIARVFEVKERPFFDPRIVHIAEEAALEALVDFSRISEKSLLYLKKLSKEFWPGPLTLILPKLKGISALLSSGLDTIAVRLPAHEGALSLIKKSSGAIAAPSANKFGHLSPTNALHVEAQLGGAVDMILDGGAAKIGLESTVLDLAAENPRILRPGGTPEELLSGSLGLSFKENAEAPLKNNALLRSPGALLNHYAPKTPLFLIENGAAPEIFLKDSAYIFFNKALRTQNCSGISLLEAPPPVFCQKNIFFQRNVFFLSNEGNLNEAASCFFNLLHTLDEGRWQKIIAEKAPERIISPAFKVTP